MQASGLAWTWRGGFPRELVEGGFELAKAELLDELVSVGLLASEPVRKEVPKNAWAPVLPFSKRGTKTVEGKRYSVTEAGRAAVGHASRLRTGFCYGSYPVREVTNFTEPAQAGGQTVPTASYTYSAAEIAGWGRRTARSCGARALDSLGCSDSPW